MVLSSKNVPGHKRHRILSELIKVTSLYDLGSQVRRGDEDQLAVTQPFCEARSPIGTRESFATHIQERGAAERSALSEGVAESLRGEGSDRS